MGLKLTMRDVGLVHTKGHGADEALELDRLTGKALTNKRVLVDHTLPALALVLSSLDDLEHLLLGNTTDLGQGNGVLGGAVLPAVLDGGGERLGVLLALTVKQISGKRTLLDGAVVLLLDVALVVGLELLLHLHLLGVSSGVHHLGLVTDHLLHGRRLLVDLTRLTLAPAVSKLSAGLGPTSSPHSPYGDRAAYGAHPCNRSVREVSSRAKV